MTEAEANESGTGNSFTLVLTLKVEIPQEEPWTIEKLKAWDEAYQSLPAAKRMWLAEALELAKIHPHHWERSTIRKDVKQD